ETLLHLFKYDTTHGRFNGQVEVIWQAEQVFLEISSGAAQLNVQVFCEENPQQLPWQDLKIDVALECTGLFRSREAATQHITAGAKRVIIGAAPFDTVDAAIV